MTQELCNKVVSEDLFVLKYCPYKHKAQEMCDKAIDFCLLGLKFVSDWFVRSKMIERIDNGVFSNDYTAFGDFVTFFSRDIGLNSITLDNINLYNGHCDYCDLKTINHVKPMI